MSCSKELIKGLIITNPPVLSAPVTLNLESLFAAAPEEFNEITVFNMSNKTVRIAYTNTTTAVNNFFFVPPSNSFTRKLNRGTIQKTTLTMSSFDENAGTGQVIFNLAQN